ncbi:MAG TPA: universal stress protein [Candidatus Methylomirabilis sp.]|nr:universal stress protein [Candidatus Methylomirabilis sp.]
MRAVAARTRTRFQNVLYATDFSAAAAQAIPYIKQIAQYYQSNVRALHVRPPAGVSPLPPNLRRWKTLDKKHTRDVLQALAGIPTHVTIEEGEIYFCVDAAIRDHDIDLLVIGTHGRTGLGKLLLGSVAEEILRTVTCPVLTVGPQSETPRGARQGFREIVYATDFSLESKSAAAYAVSLAQEFEARLTLLHVVPESKAALQASWSDLADASTQELRKLVPPEAEAWCNPEFVVERGDPGERILHVAAMREADLIVLGVQPEKGVPGAATHLPVAILHKVVAHAHCPVLTIRSR